MTQTGESEDGTAPGLPRRVAAAATILLVVLVVPAAAALLAGGPAAARGAAVGAVFGLLLALRAGWRRGSTLVPALVAGLAAGSLLAGTWWWVLLVAGLGLACGLATRVGALPGVALVGMITCTTLEPAQASVADLPRTLLSAAVGAAYAVLVGWRLGLPAVAGESARLPPRQAWPVAVVLALVAGTAALLAVRWAVPNAYWLPMTVFLAATPDRHPSARDGGGGRAAAGRRRAPAVGGALAGIP